jgi:hypothetical protein
MLCSELAASHSLQSGICVHHLNVACMKDFVQIPAMQFFAARLNLRVEKILVDHTRELAEYDCTQRRLNTIIARQYGGDAMMLYDWVMLSSDCVQELEEYKKDVAAWRCSCSLYRNASESQMIRAALVTLRADLRILRSVRFLDKYQSKPHYLDNGDGYDSSEESDVSEASSNKSHRSRHWYWQELWAQYRTPTGLDRWFHNMQNERFD